MKNVQRLADKELNAPFVVADMHRLTEAKR